MLRTPDSDLPSSPDVVRFLLSQALRLSHDLSIVLDMEGRITYANPAVSDVLGLRPEEVVGRFLWEIVSDPDAIGQALTTTMDYGQWRGTLHVSGRTANRIPLRFRTVLVQTKEGQIVGIVGLGFDDSAKERIEAQLAEIEQQRLIGQLASGVAHDFNNNLMIILGHAQAVMQEDGLSESAKRSLELIVESARNAGDLARRLQPAGGDSESEPVYVRPADVILGSVEKTRLRWEKETRREGRPVRLVTDLQASADVLARPSELDEVLTNMIFNAVDAMPQGGTLTIRAWDDEERVCISVSDDGTGMTEATRKRVGEMFFTTKGDAGHGIGLATSYKVAKKMGGRIDVDSALGEGTTFTIVLPRVDEPAAAATRTERGNPPAEPAQGARILVIEDDEGVRGLVEVAISRFRVVTAPSGERGLELFAESDYDLVLLDMSLPGKNGSQVATEIKAQNPDIPIILMSGWTKDLELNHDHFHTIVSKPFLVQDLENAIDRALEAHG